MKKVEFSYNWNKKLDCGSFSTVRIENPYKYQLLDIYEIVLTTKKPGTEIYKGLARLQAVYPFFLHNVTPAISFLDSNLSTIDFQKLVMKMYSKKNIDFKKQRLTFLVFQFLKPVEVEKLRAEQEVGKN